MRKKIFFLFMLFFAGFSCYASEREIARVDSLADLPKDPIDIKTAVSAQSILQLLDINSDEQDQSLLTTVNTALKAIDPSKYHLIYGLVKSRGVDKHKDNRIALLRELLEEVGTIAKNQQEQTAQLQAINDSLKKTVDEQRLKIIIALITTCGGIVGTVIAAAFAASC